MSWISALAWWQWLIMAVIPPLIIMLYFLKLRRTPVEVPSTFLWHKTIEDLHVNSIWQKLRQNLLLYLQLLFIALLILACLRPGMSGTSSVGTRLILLIDHSASMQATDIKPTRLEQAKAEAIELIDGMKDSDAAMVIAFSDRADVRQGFTSDRNRLRASIKSIEATNRTTDVREALRAAAGLANPGRTSQSDNAKDVQVAEALPADVFLISDGGFPALTEFDLGNLQAKYVPVGTEAAANVAIVAFNAERNSERPEEVEAYGQIANHSASEVTTTISIELDGELLDASEVTIAPGEEAGVSFQLKDLQEGKLRLSMEHKDALSLDNEAFAALAPPRPLNVLLVSDRNVALETALRTKQCEKLAQLTVMPPSEMESASYVDATKQGLYDLVIFDRCAPKEMPPCNTFFWGSVPAQGGWSAGEVAGPSFILDSDRSHPMLQYVELTSIRIMEAQPLTTPKGATKLIEADCGLVFAIAPRDAFLDAVLTIPLLREEEGSSVANTDWPRKRSFPVFMLNSLEFLGGAVTTASARTVQPGQPIALNPGQRIDSVRIVDPAKKETAMKRGAMSQFLFTQTDRVGIYEVLPDSGDSKVEMFAVNLFSNPESQLKPALDLTLGAEKVSAEMARKFSRTELWKWVLIAALAFLMLEWMVYNRRILT